MADGGWSLEVVRGRQAGRSYALAGAETVLGNAPAAPSGIDLADQEGDSPRRMAARQALVAATAAGLSVRDLDSPGGTFVNARRVLPGQSLPLHAGDVIQLGGVQLRVVAGPNGRAAPAVPSQPFVLRGGTVCRSWDDFLRVAAQRWAELREELTSGRIATWLTTIGRPDLVPHRAPSATADDHLDAWLARLPTTAPARPELDVHPARLVIRAPAGGGTIARSVQAANVGHRLLHVRAMIEGDGSWVRVADPFANGTHTVVDAVDIPLAIQVPEKLPRRLHATLRVDGDGGTKRVELVLEPRAASEPVTTTAVGVGWSPLAWLAQVAPVSRFAFSIIVLIALRVAAGAVSGSIATGAAGLDLVRVAGLFAAIAGVVGAILARRSGLFAIGYAAVSAAIAGGAVAALFVAWCRVVEPLLGAWSGSPVALALLWAATGAAKAWVSLWVAPYRKPSP